MLFALAIAGPIFIKYYREYSAFSGAISLLSLIIYALMFILEVAVLSKKQKRSQKILKKDESLKKEKHIQAFKCIIIDYRASACWNT